MPRRQSSSETCPADHVEFDAASDSPQHLPRYLPTYLMLGASMVAPRSTIHTAPCTCYGTKCPAKSHFAWAACLPLATHFTASVSSSMAGTVLKVRCRGQSPRAMAHYDCTRKIRRKVNDARAILLRCWQVPLLMSLSSGAAAHCWTRMASNNSVRPSQAETSTLQ